MIKLTEILSKPIISLSDCKIEGIVNNAVFDKNFKRLKYLILFDNNEHVEDKSLSINSIYSYGEHAIIVREPDKLSLVVSTMQTCDKNSVINCNCYTYLGKFIGKITDIILDEKYYIKSLIVNNKTIDINDVINTGEDTVIIQDEKNKVKAYTLRRRQKKCIKLEDIRVEDSQKVYILNPLEKNEEKVDNEKEKTDEINDNDLVLNESASINVDNEASKIKYQLTENPTQPKMVTTNFEFLIGRKLDRNIYSSNFELIAKKNTKITEEIIKKARILNRTRELIKFSK